MSLNKLANERRNSEFLELLRPGRLSGLDFSHVLLLAARFSRVEPSFRESRFGQGAKPYRISVLSTLSAQHFVSILKLSLYSEGVFPEFIVSGFDGITTEGQDTSSSLWSSLPDALLVLPSIDDIKSWPPMFASEQDIQSWIGRNAKRYIDIWQYAACSVPDCRVYQALFAPPLERPLGNLERRYPFSRTSCLASLNAFLFEHAPPNVTLVDFDALSGLVGRRQWNDEVAYFTSKQPFSVREMPLVAALLSRMMVAACGMVRKCLVLDLDNTLWGGVVGDDGINGIRLDPNDAIGEAFLAFQRYLLKLKERGVLLAVCSKNDSDLARNAFENHPDMILRLSDFVAFEANWEDKASNLRRIAGQLNIGIDSLVFFDDNPAERALVRQFEPEVLVVEVPEDPALFIRALDLSFAFEWPVLTSEDTRRSDSYVYDRKRHELESVATDYDAYLRSLEMTMSVEATGASALERVCQLVNKTNQFNLRTERYSKEVLSAMAFSVDYDLLHVRVQDCYTNYGIVASVVLKYYGSIAFIENWAMSCRVFKRGVEDATFNAIVDCARAHGADWLVAEYIKTAKNGYVADLPKRLCMVESDVWSGFSKLPDRVWQGQVYACALSDISPRPHFIQSTIATERN